MTEPGDRATSALIAALSDWIDGSPANAARDPEALLWGRVAKVSEEAGEATAALIGATGQNPRKGVSHTMADVERELQDVALTALCALAHLRPGADVMAEFATHVRRVVERAGIPTPSDGEPG